jgi:quaternary ammonium compound-resistance protein SugE
MAWIVLLFASLFEIGWAVCLKYTRGFTAFWPTFGFGSFLLLSVYLLGISLKSLPLGTAYTIWTGIGAVGTVVAGIMLFDESADWRRLFCIGLIIMGIIGLKLLTPR